MSGREIGADILQVDNLRIQARSDRGLGPVIVHDVSLTLRRGEVLGLIGESGAGKSTIGLAALGYTRRGCFIAGGEIFFGGMAVGSSIGDHGRGGFAHDGRNGFPGGGQGFGHEGWGDNGSGRGMMPGQGDQGYGQGGAGWDHDGNGYGQPQAPTTTPAPSTSPQALTQ